MIIQKLTPQEWECFSENAHKLAFSKILPFGMNRIDYALLIINDDTPVAYLTARELDADSVYWQFGGVFPEKRNSIVAFKCFWAALNWAKERYKRVSILVENTNTSMLKFCMKVGFVIVGIRNYGNSILLEHLYEMRGEK